MYDINRYLKRKGELNQNRSYIKDLDFYCHKFYLKKFAKSNSVNDLQAKASKPPMGTKKNVKTPTNFKPVFNKP